VLPPLSKSIWMMKLTSPRVRTTCHLHCLVLVHALTDLLLVSLHLCVCAVVGSGEDDFASRLKRVHQLSGYSDAVYCEASLTVHEYDIVLDLFVVNRTDATMSNVTLELYTNGDLKLVERPQAFNLGPGDFKTLRATIKVSSTESGEVFGVITYDASSSADKATINLNGIKVDILDYIQPATCTDAAFRSMWADFEWENKVAVNTPLRY
jgi:coatomer subunit beta